ncbi:hypothetical protein DPEC_G00134480 [Dallia pectoralis]|uniref:Uncharacterized protein n=1 Tax=Dallia pectoralis TaxID=75939 RepID=A0ACC2GSE2_DALPE|nr:hypothetical protein DPEC_G00134480 [Dallia pectoralis]
MSFENTLSLGDQIIFSRHGCRLEVNGRWRLSLSVSVDTFKHWQISMNDLKVWGPDAHISPGTTAELLTANLGDPGTAWPPRNMT